MAAMTPALIRARLMTLLEAVDPGLIRSQHAFSLMHQSNLLVDNSYTLDDERVNERSQTADVTARLDRVTLTIARKLNMDSEAAIRALLDVLDDVDRRVRQDGVSQGYHMWPTTSRVVRPEGKDYCLGTLAWTCDYDFSEAVA
jgi:hypothetical protein